jgi:type III secretion protein C
MKCPSGNHLDRGFAFTYLTVKMHVFPSSLVPVQWDRPMGRALGLVAAGAILLLGWAGASVRGQTIPWKQEEFSFFAQNEPVTNLLKEFFAVQGVEAVVSPGIEGKVNGRFTNVPPQVFFEQMARAYRLIWVYDGNVLFVNPGSEVQSQLFRVAKQDMSRVVSVLRRMGVVYSNTQLRLVAEEDLALVSGPPQFIRLFGDIAGKLGLELKPEQTVIEVFPLTNAWAYDVQFTLRDQQVTVPGVATILNDLITGQGNTRGSTGPIVQQMPRSQPALGGTGLASVGIPPGEARNLVGSINTQPAAPRPDGGPSPTLPQPGQDAVFVTADSRINAVVIRDRQDRMPAYAKLIKDLDVEVPIIEIRVAIIDLDTTYLKEVGFQWILENVGKNVFRAATDAPVGNGSAGIPPAGGLFATPFPGADTIVRGPGLNLSALIVDGGFQFLSRLHLLEQEGFVRILSQPSVVTLNNVEALVTRDETRYVRVQGSFAVDLFNVTAGLKLQVTPNVIPKPDRDEIKLLVNIQDGNFAQERPDFLPEVRDNTITTQAIILEDQSLFIGGLYREERNFNEQGAPGLRKIPILGYLFKEDRTQNRKIERMFLITPRIVKLKHEPVPNATGVFAGPDRPVPHLATPSPEGYPPLGYSPLEPGPQEPYLGPIPSLQVEVEGTAPVLISPSADLRPVTVPVAEAQPATASPASRQPAGSRQLDR